MKRRSGVPSMREASITAGSIDRTPVKLLIVAGTNAANQITRTFAASPSPSHRIVSGIQASGRIGPERHELQAVHDVVVQDAVSVPCDRDLAQRHPHVEG